MRQGATQELDLPSTVEKFGSDSVAPTMGDAELKVELKKVNNNLRQLLNLKKQANLLAVGFYLCIISLDLFTC